MTTTFLDDDSCSREAEMLVQDSIGGFRLWLSGARVGKDARELLERKITLLLLHQKMSHKEAMESIARHGHHFQAAEKLIEEWLEECGKRDWKARLSQRAEKRLKTNLTGVFTRLAPEQVFRFIL